MKFFIDIAPAHSAFHRHFTNGFFRTDSFSFNQFAPHDCGYIKSLHHASCSSSTMPSPPSMTIQNSPRISLDSTHNTASSSVPRKNSSNRFVTSRAKTTSTCPYQNLSPTHAKFPSIYAVLHTKYRFFPSLQSIQLNAVVLFFGGIKSRRTKWLGVIPKRRVR